MGRLTIDESIAHAREVADKNSGCWKHCKRTDNDCDICEEEHEQLAEWLEELKFLKQWKSDIMDSFCKYDVSSFEELIANARIKAIDDFAETIIRYVDCGHLCSPTEIRWSDFAVVEMVKKIAEQLKAGGK